MDSKKVYDHTDTKREEEALDDSIQSILIESLDNVMYKNIVNCDNTKEIWDTIEAMCEWTEVVRDNMKGICNSLFVTT